MPIAKLKATLKMSNRLNGLKRLQRISPNGFKTAMKRGAIQFLTWCNNGSPREPRKPPIRWGVLRGSSSAFVGNDLVSIYEIKIRAGGDEVPTPAQSNSAKGLTATWVWNTDYATKMHEWKGEWGPFTTQDGNAGNKWLEKHLIRDKNALMSMIAKEFKSVVGT